MRYLFIHPNFPSQHGPLAADLARDKGNQVVFLTANQNGELPGVAKVLFKEAREPAKETHHYVRGFEKAVLQGQAAFRSCIALKQQGFIPDVIFGHSGWGSTLYVKDVFPKSALICNFEWYYKAKGSDCDFDPAEPLTLDDEARIRTRNAPILLDLANSDGGIVPLKWQRDQFPKIFHPMLKVLHEGIDTNYFSPSHEEKLVIPRVNLDLSKEKEIVTYVSRGLEPYRGFPQFMESVSHLLEMRPKAHVVIVGEDRVAYGKKAPDGTSYQKMMEEKYQPDPARVHFTGRLSYDEYRLVLRNSSAHIYLTRPFVLSWSSMEAMSTGCILVTSNTAPVLEVVEHEHNGLLVDFFQPKQIAETVSQVLKEPKAYDKLRERARDTIKAHYDRNDLQPRRIQYLASFAG
jgi:glycosyltransferase involved in cell wall biosynthesis